MKFAQEDFATRKWAVEQAVKIWEEGYRLAEGDVEKRDDESLGTLMNQIYEFVNLPFKNVFKAP